MANSIYFGIFLLSVSTLAYEVSLTRIFSITLWHHFSFMVISIALLGFGAAGTHLFFNKNLLKIKPEKLLSEFALFYSIFCFISYMISNYIPFDPLRMAWDFKQFLYIIVYYILFAIPFFFSGLAISASFTLFPLNINTLYFSNLIGSGIGCIAALFVFFPKGETGAVLIISIIGISSALLFYRRGILRVLFKVLLLIVFIFLFFYNFNILKISQYKDLPSSLLYKGARLLETRYNSFSRIDIIESPSVRSAPGLSLAYTEILPEQIGITIDGGNLNPITKFDGNKESLEFTAYLPSSLPYYIGRRDNVLILDPRGGLDILTAIYHNSRNITAVESNPLICNVINRNFGDFSGYIYGDKYVDLITREPRSYIRSVKKKFDIIVYTAPLNHSPSSTGIYSLTEDYHFTEEAFVDYYNSLSEDGLMVISMYLLPPPRQEIRLGSVFYSALKSTGIKSPENYIAVTRTWGTLTYLIKHSPFSEKDIEQLKNFCRERRFDTVYFPGIKPDEVNIYNKFNEPIYYNLFSQVFNDKLREKFVKEYLFDISTVNDNRPFFYHFFRMDKLVETYISLRNKWQPFIESGYIVQVVFIQAVFLCMVIIFLPLIIYKRRININKKIHINDLFPLFLFFFFIGIGYMFIEISLIQKCILFLDNTVNSISAVIFSVLISSGIGSYSSERIISYSKKNLYIIASVLSILILIYAFFINQIFGYFLGNTIFIKFLILFLLLSIPGYFMGIFFPFGITFTQRISSVLIPWAWAVNGSASVLGSILAVIIALSFGFNSVLIIASFLYIVSSLLIFHSKIIK